MEGYIRLGAHRREFDAWLVAEDLMPQLITEIEFGEGYVIARCVALAATKKAHRLVTELRRLPVATPPPRAVLEAVLG